MSGDEPQGRLVAENRRARHDYAVEETFEAGLALVGTEVKSLREGRANIAEAFAEERGGELWLINSHIHEFSHGNIRNHDPRRPRKLLLKKREIAKLIGAIQRAGYTLVPLKLYFNARGRAKLLLGLAKGKKTYDKREDIKRRDWQRQKQRLMKTLG